MMDAAKRYATLVGLTQVIRAVRRWRKGRRLQRMRKKPITHERLKADLEALASADIPTDVVFRQGMEVLEAGVAAGR